MYSIIIITSKNVQQRKCDIDFNTTSTGSLALMVGCSFLYNYTRECFYIY